MQQTRIIALFAIALALAFAFASASAAAAEAGSGAYIAVKGGPFLPNGKSGGITSSEAGFGSFGTGFNAEVAVGIRPESYAAVELGAGYYTTSHNVVDMQTGSITNFEAFGVPVTVTAKGILPIGRLECFAGAGLGYWFGQIRYKQQPAGGSTMGKDINAGAVGYQVVGGADYRVTDAVDLGLEAKWVSVKPEFDFTEVHGNKVKWEFGGSTVNFVAKYRF